jgi:glycosyltransferase involved in cell wall biosynthesis
MRTDGVDIVVVPRDRFSMFPRCIEALFDRTDQPFRVIIVAGGADRDTAEYLVGLERQHDNVRLVLADHLLTQAEARNIGMQLAESRLCVVLENDTIVHASWLPPMLECMAHEGAAVVAPLIFWYRGVHAAGCEFDEHTNDGTVTFRHRILYRAPGARRVDYPENHCLLIDRSRFPGSDLFEDVEPFDVDLGLTTRRLGLSVFVEPRSTATYSSPPPWEVRDVAPFKFRWNPTLWTERNRRFAEKWQVRYEPAAAKRASYRRQMFKLGLARWYPTRSTVGLANIGNGAAQRLMCLVMRGESWGNIP